MSRFSELRNFARGCRDVRGMAPEARDRLNHQTRDFALVGTRAMGGGGISRKRIFESLSFTELKMYVMSFGTAGLPAILVARVEHLGLLRRDCRP